MGIGELVTAQQQWVGPRPPSPRPLVGGFKKGIWQDAFYWKEGSHFQIDGALFIWLQFSLPSGFCSNVSSSERPPLTGSLKQQLPELISQTLL